MLFNNLLLTSLKKEKKRNKEEKEVLADLGIKLRYSNNQVYQTEPYKYRINLNHE